ncbi:MAG: CDC48 family AAA ATPase [Candidatus Altiarchaeota archaeon]|nr:CDC48 family AAA ATPase [Candidatus Altiarchaeota archaeon]
MDLRVNGIPSTNQNDTGRGIVRVDSRSMRVIGATPGDPVMIRGSKITYAIIDTAYPSDIGLGMIRMDGLMRANSGAIVGERIRLSKAPIVSIQKLSLTPVGKIKMQSIDPQAVSKLLKERVLTRGDLISLRPLPKSVRADYTYELEVALPLFGPQMKFLVKEIEPKGANQVTPDTAIMMEVAEEKIVARSFVTYEDIGGMRHLVTKLREIVELPLKHPEIFSQLGIDPPKGVLMHGPPGTGKTLLARAVANETQAHFISINGPEIVGKFAGEAEERLRRLFDKAQKNAPTIIFVDEIDAIASKRDDLYGIESRIVAQLLTLMDGLRDRGQVVVIAATNRPDSLDSALRRPGRFDREISIGVPDRNGRKEILQIHTKGMPIEGVELDKLADLTPGFTGADLAGLSKEAALLSIRKILPKINLDDKIPKELLSKIRVTMSDFMGALNDIEPSALREVLVEIPKVKWDDVGGLKEVKVELSESIELPLSEPEKFKKMGIKPPRGILLYGPPGCGKTLLAKAAAHEANSNFISVKGPEVLSKWVGESEKAVRKIFKKARQLAPCIVFFDELDSIAPVRGSEANKVTERVVNQLLTELDGIEKREGVIFVSATNRPELIDPALLRPGRVDRFVYVKAPEKEARLKVLNIHTESMPLDGVDLEKISEITINFGGADLEAVCREAAMFALRENKETINQENFISAVEKVGPSLNEKMLEIYDNLKKTFRVRMPKEEFTYFR